MPELAEVEIVRRNLESWWTEPATEVIWTDGKLALGDRDAIDEALKSPPIEFLRRGKHLLACTEKGNVYFHFRMSGKIVRRPQAGEKFSRLTWKIGNSFLAFVDFRRLGEVWFYETDEVPAPFIDMGPEPFDVTVEHLDEVIGKRRSLKAALLDQSVLAGVGNIAITEIFWTLGIPPDAKFGELSAQTKADLVEEMPRYFDWVIAEQSGDEVNYTGEPGAENPFYVYKREGDACTRCGTEIRRMMVSNRSSYYCPSCQEK